MLLTLKIKLVAGLATIAAPLAVTALHVPHELPGDVAAVETSRIAYRMAGDFSRDGRPVAAPLSELRFRSPLRIMRHQVTAGDYARCAAERAPDEAPPVVDPSDPAQAWIARYEEEADRARTRDATPRPIGSFGANSNGVVDLAGNVWEWTSTCFVRAAVTDDGGVRETNRNCGVRVIEGAHRAYLTDFIREPRNGGCAFGAPPANVGFRLGVDGGSIASPRLVAARIAARLGFGG